MNHSFLEFDEPAVHEQFNVIDQKHHFALDEFSHAEGARYQHSIDVEIMKQLLEIVKRQDQILRLCAGVAMIAQNQPLEQLIDSTLAAVENKLGELK